ncbi:MAG: putative repeat protein (TIGR01451 family), partial [Kiritimatiellia bacterium]
MILRLSLFLTCFFLLFAPIRMAGAAPIIAAQQSDSFPDADMDGKANPGEQVDYQTIISNTGDMTATGLALSSPVPADTTQTGSEISTPLARDDAYGSIGNVGLTVAAANGLLVNDFDLGPTSPTVVAPVPGVPTPTSNGGSVIITAGGAGGFTYTPPVGFVGVDTFAYTIADESGAVLPAPATGANISTVTITVSDRIWFIDNTAGAGGDGTLTMPFNSLAQHNANLSDQNGDCIFVYTGGGNYDGGIVLQDDQILVGQGAGATLAAACGLTPPPGTVLPMTGGTRPVLLNSTGDAISLASGNTVLGLDIGNSSGSGLIGSSFGTATISELAVTTGGVGINLNTGTLAASFDGVTKTSSASDGIVLTSVAGNADFGAMTITSTGAGRGIRLDGTGTASSIFSGSGNISSGTGTAVDLSDCTLGTG